MMKKFFVGILILGISGLTTSCALKTRSYESANPFSRIQDKAQVPLKLNDETVILDARSHFAYGLGHWSEAVHFPWEKLAESRESGQLPKNPIKAWTSLSLVGIDPLTSVIVVGEGHKGLGEEGRLAWTLLYYGLNDVQTVSQDAIDVYFTRTATKPHEAVSLWRKEPRSQLRVGREEFLKIMAAPRESASGQKVAFIDVRSHKEYFAKSGGIYKDPDIAAVNIEWKEFYGEDGRPNFKMRSKLQALGYGLNDELIVFSNHGVRSSAAAYALLAMGFKNVRNFLP